MKNSARSFLSKGSLEHSATFFKITFLSMLNFSTLPEEEISMRIADMEEELHWSQVKLTIEIEEPEKKEPIQ